MSSGSGIDVRYVARLARLDLTEEEATLYQRQLDRLLEHVESLQRLDVGRVAPTAQVVPLTNVLRDDVTCPSLDRAQAMAGAPAREGAFFRVSRIIEEQE
ncbi:Asp-tRNA(Asn)/Glu-tRNA(Gln) amidotransferase subunit GatC [bacterium]|nr:MAG: Asp-tRNA(Asn)/Glu-tRNA(Gln) amidotransferase subunit GatC [bacterium]